MGNKALDYTALTIALIGAVNWGLVGFFNFNLVSWIFGTASWVTRIIYAGGIVRTVSDYILLTFRQRGIERTEQGRAIGGPVFFFPRMLYHAVRLLHFLSDSAQSFLRIFSPYFSCIFRNSIIK